MNTAFEDEQGVQIRVKPKLNWIRLVVLPVGLGLWMNGLIQRVIQQRPIFGESFFEIFASLVTLLGVLCGVLLFLWQILGSEAVTVTGNEIVLRMALHRFGFDRKYPVSECKRLRAESDSKSNFPSRWEIWGRGASFVYDNRRVYFCVDMSAEEASPCVDAILKRFPLLGAE
jgi:hypothetical protein